ncbi:hypothetical protein [Methylobacterium fujisawaense]
MKARLQAWIEFLGDLFWLRPALIVIGCIALAQLGIWLETAHIAGYDGLLAQPELGLFRRCRGGSGPAQRGGLLDHRGRRNDLVETVVDAVHRDLRSAVEARTRDSAGMTLPARLPTGGGVRTDGSCKGRTSSRPLWRSKTRPVAACSLNDEGARSGPFIVYRRP